MQASDFIQQVKASNPSVNLPDSEIIAKGREAGFQIDEGSGDIFSQSAQFLGNVAGGAISEIPRAAANIAATAPRILGKGLSAVGATGIGGQLKEGADIIGGLGSEAKRSIEGGLASSGYEKDSIGSAIGGIGTDIAASFLIPGGPAMKGAGYLKSASAGVVDMAKFAAAERGDFPSLGEAAAGAGFGVGFKAAGKVLGAASEKLTLAGLMNPARLRAVNEALAKGGDEILAKEGDLAGFFQNRKIYGSKEEISAKLEDVAATAKQKLDEGIASVNGTFKSEGVTSMIQSLRNSTPTLTGINSPKAAILDDLLDKSSKIGLNLQELNQVKRIIDDTINIFKRSGEEASGQKAAEWALYRNQLKRDIEDIAAEAGFKDVRALNNEIAVSKTAAEAITGKLAADQARDLLSMFVIRPGGGAFLGAGSQLGSGDPWQILKGAIFGAIAGGLTNTAVTSRVGYLLSKLSPKETGALKAFLDTRGESALPVAIEGKIKNAADSLKKQKKRIWDYEKDVVKKEDIFGNVRYEGKKGPLVDSSKAEEAAAYFDNISPLYGPEKAAARTEMEYGTNNVKRADIRKAAAKNRDTLFEEGASTTEDIGNQFEQAGNMGNRPSAPSIGGETAEDIVKGWGSVPADVVEEYVALSDRAKQYLLPYNPKTGVPLLPERGTEMARSVQGVQSRSKKIELPGGTQVAKEVETPVLAQAKGKETNLQSAKDSGSVVENTQMDKPIKDIAKDFKDYESFKRFIDGRGRTPTDVQKYHIDRLQRLAYMDKDFNIGLDEFMQKYTDQVKNTPGLNGVNIKDGKVKVYRSAIGEIQPGDWVAFDRKYAKGHAKTEAHKVYTAEVPVSDLKWAGTSAEEWYYAPEKSIQGAKGMFDDSNLKQIFESPNQLPLKEGGKKMAAKWQETAYSVPEGTKKGDIGGGAPDGRVGPNAIEGSYPKIGNESDKVARDRFDIPNLKKLGSGSDRDVYDLGDGKVLKIAKTARGLEQNSKATDYLLQETGILPDTFETGKNYVVAEKVKNFKEMTPDERKIIRDFVKDLESFKPSYGNKYTDLGKLQQNLEKWGWGDLANYDMQTFGWNDIATRNLGIKNGKPVLIDEGSIDLVSTIEKYKGVKNLDDVEFRDIYNASKQAKKYFGDIDKNTMYSIGGVLVSGAVLLSVLGGGNGKVKSPNA